MDTLQKLYHDILEKNADPRVKHWTLMGSPVPTLVIIAIYLALILVILPAYMKNRKPFNLKTTIKCYNVFQILSCIFIIYTMYTAGWAQGEIKFGCAPVDYSNNPNPVKLLGAFYWIYLLKMVELIETVFFILRKKSNQVSPLHIYHHASTYLLTYIGCKFVGGGMASFPVMVNSFIHVLMYTYYYLSSLGPEWQKKLAPWKPRLTIAQMLQFTLLIFHALTALPSSCKIPKQFLLIYLPNVVIIYKMFYDFYMKSYKKTDNTQANNSKPQANNSKPQANNSKQNGVKVSQKNQTSSKSKRT
ncbi:very long chain fatty acid elongase AAEL008004 [Leptinotarsa decemlineata]|uniref:very long chain fatty acid elongase AAEL008004 n=1 Tax=Leptinotarsa decemlineata TaxID=7539 RepID=UPI000C254360|nr:elongation of very long chain fatty acids protein AAEL008004-like [Leptinotarsa decemlineata]